MNILFIMTDTLRADYLGCYGNGWIRTPNIDRLAAEGALFTGCYSEAQPTLPARRALMTGRRTFPWKDDRTLPGDRLNLQPGWQPINDEYWTISEVLRENGYWTGFIADTAVMFKPGMNFHRGFDTFEYVRGHSADPWAFPLTTDPHMREGRVSASEVRRHRRQCYRKFFETLRPKGEYFAGVTLGRASQWLLDHGNVEKTFLWADTFDPHEPWFPPEEYQDLYTREELLSAPWALSDDPECRTEEAIAAMRAAYAGEVTKLDRWVGHLLEGLEKSGRAGDTIVVFHSDHGVPLGHGGFAHKRGGSMYQCQSRNPLIIRHPEGLGAGERINALCYNMDVVPTLLELAGVELPEGLEGQSLVPLLRGERESLRCCVTSGFNAWVMYRDERHLMFQQFGGDGTVLIDLEADPREEKNIAEGNEALVKKLRGLLESECGGLPENPPSYWGWPPKPESAKLFPRIFWPR